MYPWCEIGCNDFWGGKESRRWIRYIVSLKYLINDKLFRFQDILDTYRKIYSFSAAPGGARVLIVGKANLMYSTVVLVVDKK